MYQKNYKKALLVHARAFTQEKIYKFSDLEKEALKSFFTNTDKRVFFMHSLPTNMGNTLLAMYSRMKNRRGLRGVFVDSFLPEFLASSFFNYQALGGDGLQWLKKNKIRSLEEFISAAPEARYRFRDFLREIRVNPEYLEKITNSKKTRDFTTRWLDAYGHNSIARPGMFWICFEQISLLAAKSLEWGRPGAGYIELSTRYVDMSGKDLYPIAREIAEYGVDPSEVDEVTQKAFDLYRHFQGDNFSGPFPTFLRETHGHLFADNSKDLEAGVIGETCDVLGNFLPAATLTSVGVGVSGEAFPEMLKHLLLDETPENIALAEAVVAEARKIGADQFARHIEPTEWKKASWEYLSIDAFIGQFMSSGIISADLLDRKTVSGSLLAAFRKKKSFKWSRNFTDVAKDLADIERMPHDKLPNEFERINAGFSGLMSFRGHRDFQRQSFCAHFRTYLTPLLGFYFYDKPAGAPAEFYEACRSIHNSNRRLYNKMRDKGVPDMMMQYPLSIGNKIGFDVSANLLQWEFCNWQRSKFSVNHEVRRTFLEIELTLRNQYPWWSRISRADMTPGYVFARGSRSTPLK